MLLIQVHRVFIRLLDNFSVPCNWLIFSPIKYYKQYFISRFFANVRFVEGTELLYSKCLRSYSIVHCDGTPGKKRRFIRNSQLLVPVPRQARNYEEQFTRTMFSNVPVSHSFRLSSKVIIRSRQVFI